MHQSLSVLRDLVTYTDGIAEALIDLANEQLPSQLIDLTDLNAILTYSSNALYHFHPTYTFSLDRLEQCYRLDNVGFVITDNCLLSTWLFL